MYCKFGELTEIQAYMCNFPHSLKLDFSLAKTKYEPCHEIMVLSVLRQLILQTHMCSHPVGLDVWFLVWPFIYFHTSCVRTAKALAKMHGCAGSPEPLLVTYAIRIIISWAGSYGYAWVWLKKVSFLPDFFLWAESWQKCLCYKWKAKMFISLHIRSVSSASLLFAPEDSIIPKDAMYKIISRW